MATIIAIIISLSTLTYTSDNTVSGASPACDCQTQQTQSIIGEDTDMG